MGLFKKDDGQTPADTTSVRNPDNVFLFRILAAAYVLYMAYKTVELYIAGGEDAPQLWLLCLSLVVLGGGGIGLAITSFITWRKTKAAQAEEKEENPAD